MKILFLFVSLTILHIGVCDKSDVVVTDTPKCEDYLPADTCTTLRQLAESLHEKASIVTDAVKDAIKHHKTKAEDMLGYIKGYIAERFDCETVLNTDLCKKIFELGGRVKLTTQQIREAIETAVGNGATKIQDIYNNAVNLMASKIVCAKIFSEITCNNLKLAIQKFHEQTSLLNEAIISAAQKQIDDITKLLNAVKDTIIEKAVNFKCEDVAPSAICTRIRDVALKLHLKAFQVHKAIEMAIINGAATATDIFQQTIYFFTDMLSCELIIGKTACDNLVAIVQKLHEQRRLINEAIVEAIIQRVNNVQDIIGFVKNQIILKAINFTCTDALTQQQCEFLNNVAKKFKLRAGEVQRVLVETIVNGTNTAVQIYKVTIGQLIKDAKSVECEDLIPTVVCTQLDNFAAKFRIRKEEVSIIVKTIVAGGAVTVTDIYAKAKEYLIEKISCDTFLGTLICDSIESLTNRLHVSFKKVIEKLRDYVANGITSVSELRKKIIAYIWSLWWGNDAKRSLDKTDSLSDKIIEMIEKIITIGNDVREKIKLEIKNVFAKGELKLHQLKSFIKELIAKYGPQSKAVNEFHKTFMNGLTEELQKASQQKLEMMFSSSESNIQELKSYIKSSLKDLESITALDMTYDMFVADIQKQIKDEIEKAKNQAKKMADDMLY